MLFIYSSYSMIGGILLDIIISNSCSEPIYRQISQQIKKQILSGSLKDEEMLPSIRLLAKELQVSVITTKKAYEELENEGVVVSVHGKGFFVSSNNSEIIKEKKKQMIEDRLSQAIDECKLLGIQVDEIIEMIKLLYDE